MMTELMNEIVYSAAQAAEKLGCDVRTIHRLAKRYDVGLRAGKVFVFRDLDLHFLRLKKQGQGYQPGNQLWKRRKQHGRHPGQSPPRS